MKHVPDSVLKWWQSRSHRVRKLLVLLTVLTAVTAVYAGVLAPVLKNFQDARSAYQAADDSYHWLQGQKPLLQRLRFEAGGVLPVAKSSKVLEAQVTRELDKIKIRNTSKIVKTGEKELVRIELKRVAGTKFMRWLESISLRWHKNCRNGSRKRARAVVRQRSYRRLKDAVSGCQGIAGFVAAGFRCRHFSGGHADEFRAGKSCPSPAD